MRPGSGTETDARSDPSITAQAARAKSLRLELATIGFQRSFTRCRWLLDPLPLELTSQVETDQPLLCCQAGRSLRLQSRRSNGQRPTAIPDRAHLSLG